MFTRKRIITWLIGTCIFLAGCASVDSQQGKSVDPSASVVSVQTAVPSSLPEVPMIDPATLAGMKMVLDLTYFEPNQQTLEPYLEGKQLRFQLNGNQKVFDDFDGKGIVTGLDPFVYEDLNDDGANDLIVSADVDQDGRKEKVFQVYFQSFQQFISAKWFNAYLNAQKPNNADGVKRVVQDLKNQFSKHELSPSAAFADWLCKQGVLKEGNVQQMSDEWLMIFGESSTLGMNVYYGGLAQCYADQRKQMSLSNTIRSDVERYHADMEQLIRAGLQFGSTMSGGGTIWSTIGAWNQYEMEASLYDYARMRQQEQLPGLDRAHILKQAEQKLQDQKKNMQDILKQTDSWMTEEQRLALPPYYEELVRLWNEWVTHTETDPYATKLLERSSDFLNTSME